MPGSIECVKALLEAKALYDGGKRSSDNRDFEGETPLDLAKKRQIEDHHCYQIVNMLKEDQAARPPPPSVPCLQTLAPAPTAQHTGTPRLRTDDRPMSRAEEQEAVMADAMEEDLRRLNAEIALLERQQQETAREVSAATRIALHEFGPAIRWSIANVAEWVRQVDGGEYAEHAAAFMENEVSGDVLITLNDAELKSDLKVTKLGERKHLRQAIAALAP